MAQLPRSHRHLLACLAACVAFFHSSAIHAQTWREIQSPHFRIVTDGSDTDGRNVAKEFEQMRSVFTMRFQNLTLDTDAPLLIVAVREPGLHALAPLFWKQRDKSAGLPAVVAYKPSSDATPKLLIFEVRDDLPTPSPQPLAANSPPHPEQPPNRLAT